MKATLAKQSQLFKFLFLRWIHVHITRHLSKKPYFISERSERHASRVNVVNDTICIVSTANDPIIIKTHVYQANEVSAMRAE